MSVRPARIRVIRPGGTPLIYIHHPIAKGGREMERNKSIRTAIAAGVLGLILSAASPARTLYVDDDAPADFRTIQAAIDDANDGDTVLVAPGTYRGEGNRDIDFHGKAITVRSENGPRTCIIDCQGSRTEPHRGFYFHSGEDANSLLVGVSVINGCAYGGGGISCTDSSPGIVGCIICRNIAIYNAGGISLGRSNAWISNCIVCENDAGSDAGGVFCSSDQALRINNCTIVGNHAKHLAGGVLLGGGAGEVFVRNTIVWGNQAVSGTQLARVPAGGILPRVRVTLQYCCIEPGQDSAVQYMWGPLMEGVFGSNHNLSSAPLLVVPALDHSADDGLQGDPTQTVLLSCDYHLKSQAGRWDPNSQGWVMDDATSPCIDAGDPNTPIGQEPFSNGGRINMGAYGGTAEASKSWFGEPPCETIIAGDINGDCRVDFEDLALLARQWLEGRTPRPARN